MEKGLFIPVMVALAIVLVLGPVMGLSAPVTAADENPSGMLQPAVHDNKCICAYETTKQAPYPEYYRGRMGQLERRGGTLEPVEKKTLVCRLYTGDSVKVVKTCPI